MEDYRQSGDGEEEKSTTNPQSINQSSQQLTANQSASLKYEKWKINDVYLNELLNLDIDRNTARKALFYTDNSGIEEALNWIFDHPSLAMELSKTTLGIYFF